MCMHVVHVYNVHVHVIYTVVCVYYVHVHKVNIHTMCIYMYMTLSVLYTCLSCTCIII